MTDKLMRARTVMAAAISEVNSQQQNGDLLNGADETPLLGPGGVADSLFLVNLIVAVEQELEDITGNYVPLVDNDTVLGEDGPFQTVGSLIAFVATKLE